MPGFVDFLHSVIGAKDTGQDPLIVSGPTRGGKGGTDYRGTKHEGRQNKPAPKAGPSPHLTHLLELLTAMQGGVDATRGDRSLASPLPPYTRGDGGQMMYSPTHDMDAGDMYDYGNEMYGDPLTALFGGVPKPQLRQPPPGVNRRKGY